MFTRVQYFSNSIVAWDVREARVFQPVDVAGDGGRRPPAGRGALRRRGGALPAPPRAGPHAPLRRPRRPETRHVALVLTRRAPRSKYVLDHCTFTCGQSRRIFCEPLIPMRGIDSGSEWNPRHQALRFLIGFWWFFSIVLAATYTGNLIAVLAVPKTVRKKGWTEKGFGLTFSPSQIQG